MHVQFAAQKHVVDLVKGGWNHSGSECTFNSQSTRRSGTGQHQGFPSAKGVWNPFRNPSSIHCSQGELLKKTLSSNFDWKMDSAFVVAPEFRPTRRHNDYFDSFGVDSVPLLDLSPLRSLSSDSKNEQKRKMLIEKVGKACRDWGFFQVVSHGVGAELLDELEAEMKKFFALPLQEKRKVGRTVDNPTVGYFDSELTKNVRDWKEVFDFVQETVEMPESYDGEGRTVGTCVYTNNWPQNPTGFRDVCIKWSAAMEKLSFELLGLITESLGLPSAYFHEYFRDKNTTFIRLNHYPECPSPDLALGVSRHKDGGALTVLWQDQIGGLQVKRKDGEWIALKPRRDALVVNVGDLFQVWSNDKYMSVEHRAVVNEQKDRYSIPYFFNPVHTTDVCPVPELLDEANPPRYRTYNWGYALKRRKNGNFENLGENIQISDFVINWD